MISAKTCIVVGAGGSIPYGLPSGPDLRNLLVLQHSLPAKPTALKYRVWDHGSWFESEGLTEKARQTAPKVLQAKQEDPKRPRMRRVENLLSHVNLRYE
jgi:hypothetical protein